MFVNISSLVLNGFEITNTSTTDLAFSYNLETEGPAILMDNGDPLSLLGTTPVIVSGVSFSPPPAALDIPAIEDNTQQTVTYHVTAVGYPNIVDSCTTTITYAVVSLSAFPSPLVFAQAPGNETTCDTIYLVNDGGTTCTIAEIYGGETAPFSMDTTMTEHVLAPGDTTEIVVCVTPTANGPDSSAVTILSDSWNSPTIVPVRLDVVTAIASEDVPKPFRIVSISPNPFNPSATVRFTLPAAMPVTAEVWSVTGARVRVLANDKLFGAGTNQLAWDGRADSGSPVASGVYFVRLRTKVGTKTARAVLLK